MRILIADDHPIFRSGLKDILGTAIHECTVVAVEDGKAAIEQLRTENFNVAVLDVDMPELDGLQVATLVQNEEIETRIIILTMFKDSEIFHKAMEANVNGFLLKEHSGKELLQCIDQVMLNKRYIGKGMEEKLAEHRKLVSERTQVEEMLDQLTQAEHKTLKLVNLNMSSKEIADRLFVTTKSVENYRSRICKKLMLPPGNNSLMKWVMENKEMLSKL
jgi:DNA-binding NarL/FixJ family response regulator